MMTAIKYSTSWLYREGDKTVRRTLSSYTLAPCIEAARLIDSNPYTSDVEVLEVDTGKSIDWKGKIGRVLYEG